MIQLILEKFYNPDGKMSGKLDLISTEITTGEDGAPQCGDVSMEDLRAMRHYLLRIEGQMEREQAGTKPLIQSATPDQVAELGQK